MNQEIGFGIIGAGNISIIHGQAIASIPGARVRAFLSKTPARAQAMAAQFGAEATVDADAFFARPDIQVVTICTPSGTHADLGARAAAAGKHVIVEKPIDVTMEKARALIDACARHQPELHQASPKGAVTTDLLDLDDLADGDFRKHHAARRILA